ncbi:hypothetical protein [Sphingobacterium paludis]|nr:hypothetical protein [Sphingobacterium paludis]
MVKKYRNIDKFDPSIYEEIDTNYFYQKVGTCYADRKVRNIKDFKKKESRLRIKFYPGGYLRFLAFSGMPEGPDPEDSGERGVIYKKGDKIKIDTQSATDVGSLYKQTFEVIVDGDKIYLVERLFGMSWGWSSNPLCFVYEKAEKVPEDWKKYKPDW